MRKSRVLRDCREGIASCMKLNLNDPRVVELAGLSGFSAIWACNEHVPGSWELIEHYVRAGKIHDMDIIVRVSKGSYSDYIKAFECDAAGIMVPHVTSAQEARDIVEMCRFYPLGKRALDGGNIDGSFCRTPIDEYLNYSNTEKFIIIQIESPEAVEVVEEIAAVDGYEFLLFGAGDYSHRIGKTGRMQEPEILDARKKIEEAARKYGKRMASAGAIGTYQELFECGYGIVNLGADVLSLGQSFDSALAEFHKNSPSSDSYYDKNK